MCRADRTVTRNLARRLRDAERQRAWLASKGKSGGPKLKLSWYMPRARDLLREWGSPTHRARRMSIPRKRVKRRDPWQLGLAQASTEIINAKAAQDARFDRLLELLKRS